MDDTEIAEMIASEGWNSVSKRPPAGPVEVMTFFGDTRRIIRGHAFYRYVGGHGGYWGANPERMLDTPSYWRPSVKENDGIREKFKPAEVCAPPP